MAMPLSDLDLIRRVVAGELGAYAHLVQEYEGPIFNSIFQIVRDPDLAADITQQAFISAYEHLASFDANHRFFSWLYRIAWNEAINCYHQRKNDRPLDQFELPSSEPSPEDLLMDKERLSSLKRALGELEFKYRVVLVLRHYLDFSYAEIARIIDLPVSTVRSRIYTARVLLRDELTRQLTSLELSLV
jgi:RNA polymerase sigma-70 factor (ECF subfamily)